MESQNYDEMRKAFRVDSGNRRFRVTIYLGSLKIAGEVILTMDTRSSSRHASDFIRHFPTDYMTLSQAQIYDRDLDSVIDEPDHLTVAVNKIDALYAQELEGPQPPAEAETAPSA